VITSTKFRGVGDPPSRRVLAGAVEIRMLWPSLLLTFFLMASTPEKALAGRTPEDALAPDSEEPLQHKADTSFQDEA